jgi:very-short-patch-repair endonuclease
MNMLQMTPEQYAAHQERVKSARVIRFEANETEQEIAQKGKQPKAKAPPIKAAPKKYDYENQLALQFTVMGFRDFEVDAEYLTGRKHRADVLFRKERLVVEIQGHAHRIRDKWARDIEKAQLTLFAGYRLLPVTTAQVKTGVAADIVRRALNAIVAPF